MLSLQRTTICCGASHQRSINPAGHHLHFRLPVCQRSITSNSATSVTSSNLQRHGLSLAPLNPHSNSVRASGTGAASGAASSDNSNNGGGVITWVILGALILVGLGAVVAMAAPGGSAFQEMLVNGPVGKSGFLAAFSLIFLSEIGDKTFFIAALLAMKLGKWMSFAGSLASLAVMTFISVGIGAVIGRVPETIKSSVPVGEILGIAMLLFFGIKALREGLKSKTHEKSGADEELAEADEAVKAAEQGGKVRRDGNKIQAFIQVATLIFIAEWGDRSMLATIALGAAQNPLGVAFGAITGHAIATGIAVVGGALAAQHVSERQINIVSGVLFLVFAVATACTISWGGAA